MADQSPTRTPMTAATALFTFYDIESLSNAFTLCAYMPRPGSTTGEGLLEVFFLVDADAEGINLADQANPKDLGDAIFRANPGLPAFPATQLRIYDLRSEESVRRLAGLLGLSDAEQVNDRSEASSYPDELRPVCDTDAEYSPERHPFLAGYNSMNYDTVMLALYLSEVFTPYLQHAAQINAQQQIIETSRDAGDVADARTRLAQLTATKPALQPVTARAMREHNNMLFDDRYIDYMPGYLNWGEPAQLIRQAMMHSGRHLDVARLNEVQFKVGLKRLLGMLGRQIKESEKLGHDSVITSVEELYELLSYNVSDCLGLAQLFQHPTYGSAFDLKAGLLAEYPETIYRAKWGTSKPNISPTKVRRDRLSVDSSSAKFVGRILSPYGELSDVEGVSYIYPHPEVAKAEGREPMNVLEHCREFFETQVAPEWKTNPDHARAYTQFQEIYEYYRSIEGQNFNDSPEYQKLFPGKRAKVLRDMPKTPNNLPYFDAAGRPTACFATFSTGGIHGAEAAMKTFNADDLEHRENAAMIGLAKFFYPDARDFVAQTKLQHTQLTLPDGSSVDKRLVLLGSDPTKVKYRKPKKEDPEQAAQLARAQAQLPDPADLLARQRSVDEALHMRLDDGTVLDGKVVLANTTATSAAYRDAPSKKKPELFIEKGDGSNKLHPKYTHTSAGLVIHEDFTSYYPNLLRNMRAFWNPDLGEDRYAKIFFDKERYGAEMKRPGITPEEKAHLSTLRNGTKLILNSASGAGDASHKTPIRMNNQIISMRIMGQLFSWLIGQAQTLRGARIISTNTDGLYSKLDPESGFDAAVNNQVLAEQEREINIAIEPEEMFLISKDSNNRLELSAPKPGSTVAESRIISASGGTLACHGGPMPTKSLAHPAVIDFALARYLQSVAARGEQALAEPFDAVLGGKVIEEALDRSNPVKSLMLFQNVIAASRGSITYPFAADPVTDHDAATASQADDDKTEDASRLSGARALQMVNRVFIVMSGTDGAVSLHNAGAWKVNPASQAKRREQGLAPVQIVPMAAEILRHHGWATNAFDARQGNLTRVPADQDVVIRKINSIDPTWSMVVCNDDLHVLPKDRLHKLLDALDLEVYVSMLGETFTKNWANQALD